MAVEIAHSKHSVALVKTILKVRFQRSVSCRGSKGDG